MKKENEMSSQEMIGSQRTVIDDTGKKLHSHNWKINIIYFIARSNLRPLSLILMEIESQVSGQKKDISYFQGNVEKKMIYYSTSSCSAYPLWMLVTDIFLCVSKVFSENYLVFFCFCSMSFYIKGFFEMRRVNKPCKFGFKYIIYVYLLLFLIISLFILLLICISTRTCV